MGPSSELGPPALWMKTPLSRSGTTETPLEKEDRQAGCRPESLRVRDNLNSRSVSGDAYLEANLPVVRRRLYQGAVRLAMVLNDVFDEKSGG